MITLLNNIYKKIVALLNKSLINIFNILLPNKVISLLFDELNPKKIINTNRGNIIFFCPGRLPMFRAETLLSKEPETIEWIDKFNAETVFWDIGANVGIYSIYAGLNHKIKIFAFEPASNNFHIINENLKINNMDERISALSVAFSDQTQFSTFYMSDLKGGSAHHSFGEPINQFGEKLNFQFKQSMIAYAIDDFLDTFDISFPNYLKIDVDGIEHQIILGAEKTLSDTRLFSILIELDSGRTNYSETIKIIEKSGFSLISKHQIYLDPVKGSELANYIFSK